MCKDYIVRTCRIILSGNTFKGVAGLAPVACPVEGDEDIDCTALVSSRTEWPKHMHTELETLQPAATV